MNYHISTVTPPAGLAVTLAEAKAHLRVLHTTEDTLIEAYLKAAITHVESKCGVALITRTLRMLRDAFPERGRAIKLPNVPVTAVTLVEYADADGVTQTLAGSAYELAGGTVSAELSPVADAWPVTQKGRRQVAITYTAGYGATAADVPPDIKSAILLLTEHWYQHRSAVSESGLIETPAGVAALLGPYMTHGWI